MEICLFRHARPDLSIHRLIAPKDLPEFVHAYNHAPITGNPCAASLAAARRCALVVCSDLPRSTATADALGFDHRHRLINPLFREVDLPHADWHWPRLPLLLWALLFRSAWLLGYAHAGESISHARARARAAAELLIDQARQHERVAFSGHGFINLLIARELRRLGWQGPKRTGYRYWGFAVYRQPDARDT